jgi:HK97 family phage portal protein
MAFWNKRAQVGQQKSYRTYEVMPKVGFLPKWSEFSATRAIKEGYKRSTWVYSCVKLRAANIASVPWIVETQKAGEWEHDENHPLSQVLRRPNPSFDWMALMRMAVYWMDLSGDAYLSLIRNGAGRVVEVWPLVPEQMTVVPGRERLVDAYRYSYQGQVRTIPAEDILHLKYTNPGDLYYGLSPLQAAARAVDIDEEAEKWQKVSLQNMAVPPGLFVGPDEMSQQQYEQLTSWIREQSGPENARKPWVTAGAKWQQMGGNALEMDFVNSRKMTREEICSAYSVPPPLVGIYDNATLSNIETARQILWKEGLIPCLEEIEGQLNLQLASDYGAGVRIRYDLSNVEALADNYDEKVATAQKLFAMGVPLTVINQRLELSLELDEVAGADKGYLTSSLIPTDFEDIEPGSSGMARRVYGPDND